MLSFYSLSSQRGGSSSSVGSVIVEVNLSVAISQMGAWAESHIAMYENT
jgi:hypothetical protein